MRQSPLSSVCHLCELQIRGILAGNKQLADELLYDLKQDELARAAAAAAAAQPAPAALGGVPHMAADGAGGRSGDEGARTPAALPAGTGSRSSHAHQKFGGPGEHDPTILQAHRTAAAQINCGPSLRSFGGGKPPACMPSVMAVAHVSPWLVHPPSKCGTAVC